MSTTTDIQARAKARLDAALAAVDDPADAITAVCRDCRWLRDAEGNWNTPHKACGWPVRKPPVLGAVYWKLSEAGRVMTLLNLVDGWPSECGVHEPKAPATTSGCAGIEA